MLSPELVQGSSEDGDPIGPAEEGLRFLALRIPSESRSSKVAREAPALLRSALALDREPFPPIIGLKESVGIGKGALHLWCAPLDVEESTLAAMADTLDSGESARADAFRFDVQRNRYVAAHGAMRRILSAYLEMPPADISFVLGAYGRPELAPGANPRRLDFNLSHSGAVGVVAVAFEGRVGVDVEAVRHLSCEDGLADQIMSADEQQAWRRIPAEAKSRTLVRLWTRKEACLKADGNGLSGDPRHVPVGILKDGGLNWSLVTPQGHVQPRWAVCSCEVVHDHIISVAVAPMGAA
jgi:4'-phosphopantetheinyl transferase